MYISPEHICAVIITWNIGDTFVSNLEPLLSQVGQVLIVDNGSMSPTIERLNMIQGAFPGMITLIFNKENRGIASAQNQAIDFVLVHGYKWILFLDHDSRPENDMVLTMRAAFNSIKDISKVAVIAPTIRENNIHRKMKFLSPGSFFYLQEFNRFSIVEEVQAVVSSGSLVRTDIFQEIGKFRQDFFIDYVDIEFCLRVRVNGWKIILVPNAVLNHEIGDLKGHYFMGRLTGVTNHPPIRRYTIFKNRIIVWKRYFIRLPSYVLFDVITALYDLLKIVLFEQSRAEKLRYIARGILHGVISKA